MAKTPPRNLDGLHAEAEAIRAWMRDGTMRSAETRPVVEDAPIEEHNTQTFIVNPSAAPGQAHRAEQKFVHRYRSHMAAQGITVVRRKYLPAGEVRPIFCDAWVRARNALIEAKNSDGRNAVRQAIGQLYDYRRFHDSPPCLAVLLPYPPIGDPLNLLRSAGAEAIWPHGAGFRDSAHGFFI